MNKEQERAELHRAIWQISNDLRDSVDGWDFKQYVLGMLFYRFISENLVSYINEDERRNGNKDFDYAKLTDPNSEFGRAETVMEKGFYILPSELFVNVRTKARNDKNINETLSRMTKISMKRYPAYSATLKVRPKGRPVKMTSKACLMISMSMQISSVIR